MNVDELLPGDLIFSLDSSGMAEHIAMYNFRNEDTQFITHAVTGRYDSVMTTRLKIDDFSSYHVFRGKDLHLANQVVKRIHTWAKNGVTYDHPKAQAMYDFTDSDKFCHPKNGGKLQAKFSETMFKRNFYQYIEYAAHPQIPYLFNETKGPGVFCSEVIVAAFNLEQLLGVNAVKQESKDLQVWVSDNTDLSLSTIEKYYKPSAAYKKYLENNKSPNYYNNLINQFLNEQGYDVKPIKLTLPDNKPERGHFLPSLSAWCYTKYPDIEEFINNTEFQLPLDSKLCSPNALYQFILDDQRGLWNDCGILTYNKEDPSQITRCLNKANEAIEEKINVKEYKDYIEKLMKAQKINRTDSIEINKRFTSPGIEKKINQVCNDFKKTTVRSRSKSLSSLEQYLDKSKNLINSLKEKQSQERYKPISFFVTPNKDKSNKQNFLNNFIDKPSLDKVNSANSSMSTNTLSVPENNSRKIIRKINFK